MFVLHELQTELIKFKMKRKSPISIGLFFDYFLDKKIVTFKLTENKNTYIIVIDLLHLITFCNKSIGK